MANRSLAKYMSGTSLEWRTLRLYFFALMVLIAVAFLSVRRITKDLLYSAPNSEGRQRADLTLARIHFLNFERGYQNLKVDASAPQRLREEVEHLTWLGSVVSPDAMQVQRNWNSDVIALPDETLRIRQKAYSAPRNQDESEIVLRLKEDQLKHWETLQEASQSVEPVTSDRRDASTSRPQHVALKADFNPVYRASESQKNNRYYYYQPVYWGTNCLQCHDPRPDHVAATAMSPYFVAQIPPSKVDGSKKSGHDHHAGNSDKTSSVVSSDSMVDPAAMPFFVIRIDSPNAALRDKLNKMDAILLATAFLIIAIAAVSLLVIVRYVIIKPLGHLRRVSEAITAGDLAVRANLHSGGEFEELAESFNKMLQNLVDTQQEIRGVNKNLDQKVDELAQLNMRLYEMNRVKSEFLATMTHELRTPLNSIMGFSDLLESNDSLTERQRRYAKNIRTSGRTLLDMINNVLDVAKLEAGRMDVRVSEMRFEPFIQALCDELRMQGDKKNIDIDCHIEGELPTLHQDVGKIRQIVTNLLSNAIKFTPEGGRINVHVKKSADGRLLVVEVSDTGVGIPEADREIIFEKFRQGSLNQGKDNLTREYAGTGLGLSIVRELCKLLGGEVSVESDVGKGSTFRVVLPFDCTPAAKATAHGELDDMARPRLNELLPVTHGSNLADGAN
jgi:two-component system sensor histidine kinase BarA